MYAIAGIAACILLFYLYSWCIKVVWIYRGS